MTARKATAPLSPSDALTALIRPTLDLAKTARRQKKGLDGDNFYGNKLATLRAEATNLFRALVPPPGASVSSIATLIEQVFASSTNMKDRISSSRALSHELATAWRSQHIPSQGDGLFPLSLLSTAKRGYLMTVGSQMNGAYGSGWYDAAAVMMRRLIEIAIIEAYEAKSIASKVKDPNGSYLQLTDLIKAALAEPMLPLSRNAKKVLPALRDVGHMSAHGRYYCAQKADLDLIRPGSRIVIEEFLRHAGLL